VLGQLPHDLLITTGFGQVVLPASIIGALGAILLNFLVNQDQHEQRHDSHREDQDKTQHRLNLLHR
jgi:hypothetical protein